MTKTLSNFISSKTKKISKHIAGDRLLFSWSISSNYSSFSFCLGISRTDNEKFTRVIILHKLFLNVLLCKNSSNYTSTSICLEYTCIVLEDHVA